MTRYTTGGSMAGRGMNYNKDRWKGMFAEGEGPGTIHPFGRPPTRQPGASSPFGGGAGSPMSPGMPGAGGGFQGPGVGGDPYSNTDTGGLSDRGGGGGLQTPMTPPYQGPSYNLQTQNTYNTQQQTSNVQNVQNTENSIRQGQQQRAVGKNTLRPVGAQSYGMGQQMIGNPGYAVQQLKMMNALLGLG